MIDPAHTAAAEIADKVMGYREFDVEATAEIIQRALLSAQRPYVEWIMKCDHNWDCPQSYDVPRDSCTCGLSALRDELRKQVGGEK